MSSAACLDRSAYGLTEERLQDIAGRVSDVGFVNVDTDVVDVAGESIALVLAAGPGS